MTFNPPLAKLFLDSTEADAIRTLRPDGPLDSISLSTRCKHCGTEVIHPLRWFYDCEFICSCGGEFDREPLNQILIEGAIKHLAATKTPDEIIEICKNSDSDA